MANTFKFVLNKYVCIFKIIANFIYLIYKLL